MPLGEFDGDSYDFSNYAVRHMTTLTEPTGLTTNYYFSINTDRRNWEE